MITTLNGGFQSNVDTLFTATAQRHIAYEDRLPVLTFRLRPRRNGATICARW